MASLPERTGEPHNRWFVDCSNMLPGHSSRDHIVARPLKPSMATIAPAPLGSPRPTRWSQRRGADGPVACALAITLLLYWDAIARGSNELRSAFAAGVLIFAIFVAVRAARSSGDAFNPLTVLLVMCIVRLGLPAVLLRFTEPPVGTVPNFGLSKAELEGGEQLAMIGVLSVLVGWYVCPAALTSGATRLYHWVDRMLREDPRLRPSATCAFGLGIVAIGISLTLSFGNPVIAAISGSARSGAAPGTSRFTFVAIALLTTSSVVIALHLARRRTSSPWAVYLPALLATALLTILGGRITALTPLFLAVVGVRYIRQDRTPATPRPSGASRRAKVAVASVALGIVLLGYVAFVPQYRGGEGASALGKTFDVETLSSYGQNTIWIELGQLYPYALAPRVGGGAMHGSTYPEVLGLAGSLAGIHGERPGIVLAQLSGRSSAADQWGFQTGLPIDIFLNSGLTIALLGGILFGAVLRAEYVGFRRAGPNFGSTFIHCLALSTMIWVYFESLIVLTSQFLVSIPILVLIFLGIRLLPEASGGRWVVGASRASGVGPT